MPRHTPTSLSRHAEQRLAERFRISKEVLLDQLNVGQLGVKLGVSKDSSISHRLVWSLEDNAPLVVIQNVVDGAILTVLTLEMYRCHYPERVIDRKIERALNQLANRRSRYGGAAQAAHSQRVTVTGFFRSDDAFLSVATAVHLGKWKAALSSEELESLGSDMQFWSWVAERIRKKGLLVDNLSSLTVGYTMTDRIPLRFTADDTAHPSNPPGVPDG